LLGDFAAQVSPVVVVTLQDSDIPMARETLHGADVASCEVQSLCDSRMTQTVGPYLQADLPAKFADHSIKADRSQTALTRLGSIHGAKKRTRIVAPNVDLGFQCFLGFRRKG
jgi:hypothetical protein